MTKLSVHHIGARGETQALPALRKFDASIVNVLYEADEKCIAELREINASRTAKVIIVPRCISGQNGSRIFYDACHEYGSSLLEVNPDVGALYVCAHWIDHDYSIRDALSPISSRTMHTETLDSLIDSTTPAIPLPDFLSLDTQGSELEILRGAPRALDSAMCIVSEVEFLPLYKDQPLFGDVCRHLTDRGFVFSKFFPILAGNPYRAPLGLRGETIPVTTDALFLRNPHAVLTSSRDPFEKHLALRKLMFFSIIYGFFDHALWAVEAERDVGSPSRGVIKPEENWYQFVEDFLEVARGFPPIFPQTFSEHQLHGEPGKQASIRHIVDNVERIDRSLQDLREVFLRFDVGYLSETLYSRLDVCYRSLGIERAKDSALLPPWPAAF
ncbi:MAG: FkbM family methyltransferase [Betaproteobacteria bacterium]